MILSKNQFIQWFADNRKKFTTTKVEGIWEDWDRTLKIIPVQRQPEFFAQCAHESGNFLYTAESLNYLSPNRIMQIFPRKVKTYDFALTLVNAPIALANVVYRDHKHLGNNSEGAKELYKKGWLVHDFRGQGYIQLTGYNNWNAFKNDTGIDCFKEKDFFIKRPWMASSYFWFKNYLDYEYDMKSMTKKINGGYNGLDDRIKIFKQLLKIMKSIR